MTVSVREDIMGKVCNMSAQLAHQAHTSLKVHRGEWAPAFPALTSITPLHLEALLSRTVFVKMATVQQASHVKWFTAQRFSHQKMAFLSRTSAITTSMQLAESDVSWVLI